MLKAYFYKNHFTFLLHNCLGLSICAIFYFFYSLLSPSNEVSGFLNISILFLIIVLFSIIASNSYLVFIPSAKIYVKEEGIEVYYSNKKVLFYAWDIISKIELKIENHHLLNFYLFLIEGGSLRFILMKKWHLSIIGRESLKTNFSLIEFFIQNNTQFKRKFDIDHLIAFTEHLK
ncbi:hypothetical protein [Lacihabitans soyangensis]|uniref:Uncharacterized protein n=1 Tax=Lacihabitans soyangensis TaxID=869394 RepID=A0AAE3H0E0_9BACT|nr:hypothetical protein [Lacihabitans soyangensis]MCP9761990.1 hypothetical protein [Lacihabitans soyangensis]